MVLLKRDLSWIECSGFGRSDRPIEHDSVPDDLSVQLQWIPAVFAGNARKEVQRISLSNDRGEALGKAVVLKIAAITECRAVASTGGSFGFR